MRIALLGYGRTGREVERMAVERGHEIVLRCNSRTPFYATTDDVDVAIDFSRPDLVFAHVAVCLDRSIPMVIGTTGWYDKLPALQELARQSRASIVYGSNFSIGMHMFRDLVANLASHIDIMDEYDIAIDEIHHRQKIDAPSGTALTLSRLILDRVQRKTNIQTSMDGGVDPAALSVTAVRVGVYAGTHTVVADSNDDTLELIHRAKNRQGFARGAVRVAEWIVHNEGCFDVADVFQDILTSRA